MPVAIKGSGGGSVTLDASTAAADTTLTLPNTTGTVALTASPTFSGTVTATTITSPAATALTIQSAGITAITVDTSQNMTTAGTVAMASSFKRNRIINGNMLIDQRNAGASVTPTAATYTMDRWTTNLTQASKFSVQQNAGSVTPPAGFTNYLGVTSLSSYSVLTGDYFALLQNIEGFNASDLAWGTANAKTVTLSFWVRSSLTGTFGGSLTNSAINRSYPFTYTISSANTWEQKSITIAGDTTGTWLTDNGVGIRVYVGLGAGATYSGTSGAWAGATYLSATGAQSVVGTNGATLYITGVQLEVGSVATPYERQIYSDQLAQCQRYFLAATYFVNNSATGRNCAMFPVTMRSAPVIAGGGAGYSSYVVTTVGFCNDQTTASSQNLTFSSEL